MTRSLFQIFIAHTVVELNMTTFKNVCLVDSYHDIILDPVVDIKWLHPK